MLLLELTPAGSCVCKIISRYYIKSIVIARIIIINFLALALPRLYAQLFGHSAYFLGWRLAGRWRRLRAGSAGRAAVHKRRNEDGVHAQQHGTLEPRALAIQHCDRADDD